MYLYVGKSLLPKIYEITICNHCNLIKYKIIIVKFVIPC